MGKWSQWVAANPKRKKMVTKLVVFLALLGLVAIVAGAIQSCS